MIAVDIFADVYGLDDTQRERSHRVAGASKSLFMMVRRGASAVSPMIFVDAALATLDAVGAYARYRQAKEITAQLNAEADKLGALLGELNQQLKVKTAVAEAQFARTLDSLRLRLQQQTLEIVLSEERFSRFAGQIKLLGQAIAKQRLNAASNCVPLLQLEAAYYQLVDAQLQTALDLIKE